MDKDCIFCKIVAKEIPSDFVDESEELVVFKDINPKAKIHYLIVPRKHITDMREADEAIWSAVQKMAIKLGESTGLEGYTLGCNMGKNALVKHMHVHFLDKLSEGTQL